MNTQRAFTLIELLVVIAIIGILSAVVLASLSTARDRARDASIKSGMNSLGSQAELYNLTNGYYAASTISNSCSGGMFSDTTVAAIIAQADASNGTAGSVTCYASSSAFAVSAARPSADISTYWCTDSTGKKCGINTNISGTACGTCVTSN